MIFRDRLSELKARLMYYICALYVLYMYCICALYVLYIKNWFWLNQRKLLAHFI